MKLTAIVAIDENRVMGANNTLPWHLPADLQHFKKLTINKPILMGRKTFTSIGRALPQRRNVIVTRDTEFTATGCEIYPSPEVALTALADCPEVMLIGGAQLFVQLMSRLTDLELTVIHHQFTGDVYFPEIDWRQWQQINNESHPADQKNPYAYTFYTYKKI